MSAETDHILDTFRTMLTGPTGDGKTKRDAGTKPHWTIDQSHYAAAVRHWDRWGKGEQVDGDSGCHPLVHVAWRLLAVAWQEMEERGEAPGHPIPGIEADVPGQEAFWDAVKLNTDYRSNVRPQVRLIDLPAVDAVENIANIHGRWWLRRPDTDEGPVELTTGRIVREYRDGTVVSVWREPDPRQSADHDE